MALVTEVKSSEDMLIRLFKNGDVHNKVHSLVNMNFDSIVNSTESFIDNALSKYFQCEYSQMIVIGNTGVPPLFYNWNYH